MYISTFCFKPYRRVSFQTVLDSRRRTIRMSRKEMIALTPDDNKDGNYRDCSRDDEELVPGSSYDGKG